MVVQPGERNFFDQRLLEYTIYQRHSIPVVRKSLTQIHAQGTTYLPI